MQAHPGSPPPECTASGQGFCDLRLVRLHGLWPDIRVCRNSGQLFWGMAAQTADMADSLSDNADDLLRHAPPGYKFDEDLWPDIRKLAKHILDVACQGEPECEPKRDEMSTFLEKPAQAVGVAIEKLHAAPLPAPLDLSLIHI